MRNVAAIDPHTHIYPEGFIRDLRAGRFGRTAAIETDAEGEWIITRGRVLGRQTELRNRLTPLYYELEPRFADMERMGVSRQVLSVGPAMTLYALEAEANRELAASLNDGLSALACAHPDRLSCMATVPLQAPEAAAEELARARANGHLGVMIASNVAGRNLDDPALDVFWARAEALDMPVFVHPTNVLGADDRLKDYYLRNLIGNPLDTTIAAACLIFGGVLDRFPKLRFWLAHLGGFTPWIRGRWRHGYAERGEPKARGAGNPEAYLGRFCYDAVIHGADAFAFAVNALGAERILYGTDYPADMGCHRPAREIPGLSRLPEAEREMILSGNARRVYRLAA